MSAPPSRAPMFGPADRPWYREEPDKRRATAAAFVGQVVSVEVHPGRWPDQAREVRGIVLAVASLWPSGQGDVLVVRQAGPASVVAMSLATVARIRSVPAVPPRT